MSNKFVFKTEYAAYSSAHKNENLLGIKHKVEGAIVGTIKNSFYVLRNPKIRNREKAKANAFWPILVN